MMKSQLLLIISSIGIAQGLFWSIQLISSGKRDHRLITLGLLLMAFSIRMLKSILFVYEINAPLWFMNVGFAMHLFIGPLLLAYTGSASAKFKVSHLIIHGLPGIVVLLLSGWLTLEGFWYTGGYTALLIQSVIYLVWSTYSLVASGKDHIRLRFRWLSLLHFGVGAVLLVYFSNYILRLLDYSWGPVSFSLVIYAWSFFLVRHYRELHRTKSSTTKYKNLEKLGQDRITDIRDRIETHFQNSSTYLDPAYSLSKLSQEINISKHLISKVLNTEMKVSFNEYVNRFRITKAQKKLVNSPYLTIASIAFDAGFNSLSTFNQAFKKVHGSTPSAYRESAKQIVAQP